jgi:REP element-mobilizing transposase RayT
MANRPPRLSGFSYGGRYQYFLTICTCRRQKSFQGEPEATWMTGLITHFFECQQFAVIAYCVMPDHVHLLIEGLADDADLKAVMHDWKQETAFAWKQRTGARLWQEGYYDHIVREDDPVIGIVRYILDNPFRAGLVADGATYRFSGSSRFTQEELRDALIDWHPPWE